MCVCVSEYECVSECAHVCTIGPEALTSVCDVCFLVCVCDFMMKENEYKFNTQAASTFQKIFRMIQRSVITPQLSLICRVVGKLNFIPIDKFVQVGEPTSSFPSFSKG